VEIVVEIIKKKVIRITEEEIEIVMEVIQQNKWVSEKHLLVSIWRDINNKNFDLIIDILIKRNEIERKFEGPKNESGIWYKAK
jgi:hypothetical protein